MLSFPSPLTMSEVDSAAAAQLSSPFLSDSHDMSSAQWRLPGTGSASAVAHAAPYSSHASSEEYTSQEAWLDSAVYFSLLSPTIASSHSSLSWSADSEAKAALTAATLPLSLSPPTPTPASTQTSHPSAPSSAASHSHTSLAVGAADSVLLPAPTAAAVIVTAAHRAKRGHREIDAERRQREATAVRRLEELTSEAAERRSAAAPHRVRRSQMRTTDASRSCMRAAKRDKVAVLEASAEKIERLEALLQTMSTRLATQQQQQQQQQQPQQQSRGLHTTPTVAARERMLQQSLADHLHGLAGLRSRQQPTSPQRPASSLHKQLPLDGVSAMADETVSAVELIPGSMADAVLQLDSHQALYSAMFVHGTIAFLLRDMATGTVIEANESTHILTDTIKRKHRIDWSVTRAASGDLFLTCQCAPNVVIAVVSDAAPMLCCAVLCLSVAI